VLQRLLSPIRRRPHLAGRAAGLRKHQGDRVGDDVVEIARDTGALEHDRPFRRGVGDQLPLPGAPPTQHRRSHR
jgi:hypothetical protein